MMHRDATPMVGTSHPSLDSIALWPSFASWHSDGACLVSRWLRSFLSLKQLGIASGSPLSVFQRSQPPGCMPTFACQTGESLAHGPVQALDKGGVERRSSVCSRKQGLRL